MLGRVRLTPPVGALLRVGVISPWQSIRQLATAKAPVKTTTPALPPWKFTTLVEMLDETVARVPKNNVIGSKTNNGFKWTTYGAFGKMVDDLRGAMVGLGVKKGDKVAVISSNRLEWAVGAFASFSVGATYVPMYEQQLAKDWEYIIQDSDASLLLVSNKKIFDLTADYVDKLGSLKKIVNFEGSGGASTSYNFQLEQGAKNPAPKAKVSEEDVACIIYTSGTTGKPKGVELTHRNFVSNVRGIREHAEEVDGEPVFRESDLSLVIIPWAHAYGMTVELYTMMATGAAMAISESTATVAHDLRALAPTTLFCVPTLFNRMHNAVENNVASGGKLKQMLFHKAMAVSQERRLLALEGKSSAFLDLQYNILDNLVLKKIKEAFGGRLRCAQVGGAAVAPNVLDFVENLGIKVCEGYGLSETAPLCATNSPTLSKVGTVGKPLKGVTVSICDGDKVLPFGEEGEICVSGPNVMKGYRNRPDETAKVIFELNGQRCFRTGDLGRFIDGGFLKITGRIKEQYKLENGKYVVPGPIEEAIVHSRFIDQAYVYGQDKPFNVALLMPDFTALKEWASKAGIADTAPAMLVRHPDVLALFAKELAAHTKQVKGYEQPRRFHLMMEPFSVQNSMLTQKLSIKRHVVNRNYMPVMLKMYEDAAAEKEKQHK